ncbi:unnamed protein product [Caenorhabditis angaria]|uniref:Phospholipase A(2) n=1 Tax=Caenorhabditis angaria TaxID=860376 RepID=A0A9P1IWQ1_9PELO|nr:unnamed protein product [Caenorhabditis angaria]
MAKLSLNSCAEKYDYNHCCAIHDDCYSQSLGQVFCDKQFCECTQQVANQGVCREFAEFSCSMVELFGKKAYADKRQPEYYFEKYQIKKDSELAKTFPKIYDKCNTQWITFRSCGYRFDTCMRKESSKKCHTSFATCVTDSKKHRKPNAECDQEIENLTKSFRSKRSVSKWYCGSGPFSTNLAKLALSDCNDRLEYNLCCGIHDDCYDSKKGQKFCDQQFCECNKRIKTCSSYSQTSCMIVKTAGKESYNAAGNPNPYQHDSGSFNNNPELGVLFESLTDKCADQPASFGALATRYEACVNSKKKDCENQLLESIIEIKTNRSPNIECDDKSRIIEHYIRTNFPSENV